MQEGKRGAQRGSLLVPSDAGRAEGTQVFASLPRVSGWWALTVCWGRWAGTRVVWVTAWLGSGGTRV